MGISEKGIWNSTAGEPQPGHKARINPFSRFRRDPENQTRDAQYTISWKQLKMLFSNNR